MTVAVLAVAVVSSGSDAVASTGGVSANGPDGGDSGSATDDKYSRIWENQVSSADKRWARTTAECESGGDPNAVGGGGEYRGAFMFLRSSWKNSPKSPGGDPIDFSYKTQAVVAVLLKKEMGTSPWPVCG